MICEATDETLVPLSVLATALGLPRLWLRDEALAGRIPCLRAGKRLRFHVEAVRACLVARAARETLPGEGASDE
jgi:hypothetical protein